MKRVKDQANPEKKKKSVIYTSVNYLHLYNICIFVYIPQAYACLVGSVNEGDH